jgi:hypothetical protein
MKKVFLFAAIIMALSATSCEKKEAVHQATQLLPELQTQQEEPQSVLVQMAPVFQQKKEQMFQWTIKELR